MGEIFARVRREFERVGKQAVREGWMCVPFEVVLNRVFRWWSWSSLDEELLDGVFVVARGVLEGAGRTTEGAQ